MDTNEGKKVFISYVDDDDKKVSTFVDLLEFTDSVVKFKTNHNIISLPVSRLLKIKEKTDDIV